jgi:hypothetical protein
LTEAPREIVAAQASQLRCNRGGLQDGVVDKRRNSYWIPVLLVGFAGRVVYATVPGLQISTETAPAGGWAQIEIYAVKPMAIAAGHLVLSLDSTAFGPGAMAGLFGANGDAQGLAAVTASQMDIQFSSASGGIGQLAGLPVLVVSVPVLAAATGRTVSVTATSPDSSVSLAGGSVTVQGTLSVARIPAGMGVVPAGTVVPVMGTGFTPSTTVTIDAVAIVSTQFVSAQEVDVTLGGAAELVGKRAGEGWQRGVRLLLLPAERCGEFSRRRPLRESSG